MLLLDDEVANNDATPHDPPPLFELRTGAALFIFQQVWDCEISLSMTSLIFLLEALWRIV